MGNQGSAARGFAGQWNWPGPARAASCASAMCGWPTATVARAAQGPAAGTEGLTGTCGSARRPSGLHPCYLPFTWRPWRPSAAAARRHGLHTITWPSGHCGSISCGTPIREKPRSAVIRIEAEASEIHPETYPRRIKASSTSGPRQAAALEARVVQRRSEAAEGGLARSPDDEWGCLVGGEKGRSSRTAVEHAFVCCGRPSSRLQGAEPTIPRRRPSCRVVPGVQGARSLLQLRHWRR